MILYTLYTLLAFAVATRAYTVTAPNSNSGWVSPGTNTVTWNRASTDPTTFDLVLTNTVS